MLVQKDATIRERTVALLQEQLRRLGISLDVVGLDLGSIGKRWMTGDYDSIFHGFQASATDPAMNAGFLAQFRQQPFLESRAGQAGDRRGKPGSTT